MEIRPEQQILRSNFNLTHVICFSLSKNKCHKAKFLLFLILHRSGSSALRDSYSSLFLSDVASDFTDVTNTDILLSERFGEESSTHIRKKKESARTKARNSDLQSPRQQKSPKARQSGRDGGE